MNDGQISSDKIQEMKIVHDRLQTEINQYTHKSVSVIKQITQNKTILTSIQNIMTMWQSK